MNEIGAMNWITAILVIIFTVVNLKIYHKRYHVLYFDLGRGLLKEIAFSFMFALVEAGIIISFFEGALSVIGKIIMIVLKILLVLVAVAVVIGIIWKIVQVINENSGLENSEDGNSMQMFKTFIDEKTKLFKEKAYEVKRGVKTKENTESAENVSAYQYEKPMLVCKKCAKRFSDNNMKFCTYCGEKLEKEQTPETVDEAGIQ